MAWVAVNKDGSEVCSNNELFRHHKAVTGLIERYGKVYESGLLGEDYWCDEVRDDFTMFYGRYLIVPKFNGVALPKGSIKKLIGRELNWSDEPVKLE